MNRNDAAAKVRAENRNVSSLMIYRWLVGTVFLLAAFSEFKAHWLPIALGSIVIGQGFVGILAYIELRAAAENAVLDLAERKTRHTIVIAQQWAVAGQPYDTFSGFDFWRQVNDAVENEYGIEDDKPPWWTGLGLTLLSILYRIIADVIGIGIAYTLAGVGST